MGNKRYYLRGGEGGLTEIIGNWEFVISIAYEGIFPNLNIYCLFHVLESLDHYPQYVFFPKLMKRGGPWKSEKFPNNNFLVTNSLAGIEQKSFTSRPHRTTYNLQTCPFFY